MTMQNTIIEGHNQRLETIPKFIVKYLTSGIPDETSSIHREAASPEMRSHPGRCLAIAASHPPSILSDCKKALVQQARISTKKCPSGYLRGIFLWRWADSNRRPNTAPGGFLHAYFTFDCRPRAADERAILGLSFGAWAVLKESAAASGLDDTPWSEHNRRKVPWDTRRARSLGGPD